MSPTNPPTPDAAQPGRAGQLPHDGRPLRVLGVWAHPDDESYLSAGLVLRTVRAGGTAHLLTATRGEAGFPIDDPRHPTHRASLREAELRSAARHLGARLLAPLGHPDGVCAEVDHEVGVAQVRAALEAVRPDLVVTFGPDGITGHADHIAVGRWTTDAWARSGRGELLYTTMTEEFLVRKQALHDRVGVFGDHVPVGVPASEVDVSVTLDDDDLDTKRRALAAHASQTPGLARAMGEDDYRRWFDVEHFRRPTDAEVQAARAASATTAAIVRAA